MDRYEEAVMEFLTKNGTTGVFVCPQWDAIPKWKMCPDFVALQPAEKTVFVVEVSSAATPSAIQEKLSRTDWLEKVYKALADEDSERKVIDSSWKLGLLAFVRSEWVQKLEREPLQVNCCNTQQPVPVTVYALEDILPGWRAWNISLPKL